MPEPRFDPSRAIRFDLVRGQLELDGASRLLIPAEALAALCKGAGPDASIDFGRRLGTEVGRRVAERLGLDRADIESVVEHLGGDLALIGFGSLTVERWGRALVFNVTGSPLGAEGDALLAAVLEGALQRGFTRDTRIVLLARDSDQVRLLVSNPRTAPKVRGWLSDGTSWGQVLERLHTARGEA